MKSKFGRGFIYPLVLYALHLPHIEKAETFAEFYISIIGALDHLGDIVIPDDLPKKIVKDIEYLKNRIQKYKIYNCKDKIPNDRLRIINQSKKLFFDIDKYYLKVNPIRSEG